MSNRKITKKTFTPSILYIGFDNPPGADVSTTNRWKLDRTKVKNFKQQPHFRQESKPKPKIDSSASKKQPLTNETAKQPTAWEELVKNMSLTNLSLKDQREDDSISKCLWKRSDLNEIRFSKAL